MGRRKAKTALITFIITFLIVGLAAGFVCFKLVSAKQAEIDELTKQKADAKCWAFARDIKAGTIITQNDIKLIDFKDIYKASGMYMEAKGAWTDSNNVTHKYASRYINSKSLSGTDQKSNMLVIVDYELIGRKVKSNVSENTPVLDSLLYSKDGIDAKDVRLEELNSNYLNISPDLYVGDYFDVRIQFPEGQDYTVLVGKYVEGLGVDDTGNPVSDSIYAKLNEEEHILLGSAIVEAYMQNGVRLYTTKYSDPSSQLYKESIVDYVKKYEDGLATAIAVKEYQQLQQALLASGDATDIVPLSEYVAWSEGERNEYVRARNAVVSVDEKSITVNDIAVEAGIAVEYVQAIKDAKEGIGESPEDTLNFYRCMRVQTRQQINKTYAVKDEVLEVVRNNPNLIDQIKAEFDARAVANTRIDKYKKLEAEMASAPEVSYDPNVKTRAQIKAEMDALVGERAENIEKKLSEEAKAQKDRRVAYLQTLIDAN